MADNKLFSADTETYVIAGILNCPALVHSTDGLRHSMFSSSPYKIIFKEFEDLREQNLLPDFQIVLSSLESKGLLEKAGGKKNIEDIRNKGEVSEEAFVKFVEIVVASFKARAFLSTLASVKKDSLTADNINQSIGEMKESLEALVGLGGGESTIHISEIVNSTYNEIIKRMENPGIRGASWGVSSIDRATGGKSPGDLVIIAARPGAGKTSVICNSVLTDGMNGVPSLMISREMRPQELMERLISIDAGIPSTNIRLGMMNQYQLDAMHASFEKIKKLPIYLDYNFRTSDPYYLLSTVNKYVKQKGVQVVYLDYIQMATERDEGQTMEIGRLTKMFKGLSNGLNICSVLASQLNRGVEARDDKRPLLSDMRQSGAIEEDADFVIGLYRDEYYNKETKAKGLMEYIILKHRNGPPGTVPVKFDGPTYKISEA
jgi:replicative DNA helicase